MARHKCYFGSIVQVKELYLTSTTAQISDTCSNILPMSLICQTPFRICRQYPLEYVSNMLDTFFEYVANVSNMSPICRQYVSNVSHMSPICLQYCPNIKLKIEPLYWSTWSICLLIPRYTQILRYKFR
jgi:hypothetical protein